MFLGFIYGSYVLATDPIYTGKAQRRKALTVAQLGKKVGKEVLGEYPDIALHMVVQHQARCYSWLIMPPPLDSPFPYVPVRRGDHVSGSHSWRKQ